MAGRRIRIHGRVQGVFFRQWTADRARALGIRGWVRNRLDGSVEIEAHGEERALESLTADCRAGPPAAAVGRIDVERLEGQDAPDGFRVVATA